LGVYGFDARDGGLRVLGSTPGGNNPSFLAVDAAHQRLYAANEGSNQVAAFNFNLLDGGLALINRVASGGAGPAHVSVDGTGQFVFVANYNGGSIAVLPAVPDGGLSAASQVDPAGAQAHQIFSDGAGRFVYAPCKGANHVAQYSLSSGTLTPLSPASMATAAGAGPRHLALHPTLPKAYLINENVSTMQTLSIDSGGRLSSVQTLSTLPAGFTGNNTGAEVAVHPNGRFVFGSNRGHDSIARFSVDASSGQLTLLGHTPTGGRTPRHFSIDPSGDWLIVGNQNSNSVVLFHLDQATGTLTSRGNVATVTSPSFVGFVAVP
jgi:6-phosphogluconolactonase